MMLEAMTLRLWKTLQNGDLLEKMLLEHIT